MIPTHCERLLTYRNDDESVDYIRCGRLITPNMMYCAECEAEIEAKQQAELNQEFKNEPPLP